MTGLNPKLHTSFYARLAFVLVNLIALCYICISGKQIIAPLVYAFLFAILLLPLARFFEAKTKLSRAAAAGLSVILLVLFVFGIIYIVGSQISGLAREWPSFKQTYLLAISGLEHWMDSNFHITMANQANYVNSATSKLITSENTIIGDTVISVSFLLLFLLFTMIDTFCFLFYRRLLIRFLIEIFRRKNSGIVYEIVAQVQFITRKYILAILLEMAIVSAVLCITFSLIGIKYAILLGLIAGILNVIPYAGIFSSLVLTVLITIGTASSGTPVILVIITVILTHFIDTTFIFPLLVRSKVKVNAFITFLGVAAGGMAWGIPGAFISIPVIAICKIVFDRVESLKPWGLLFGDGKTGLKL